MRRIERIVLAVFIVAALGAGASALLVPTPGHAAGPPGQENCTKPCRQWQVIRGLRCKFVGCDINGVCRYLC